MSDVDNHDGLHEDLILSYLSHESDEEEEDCRTKEERWEDIEIDAYIADNPLVKLEERLTKDEPLLRLKWEREWLIYGTPFYCEALLTLFNFYLHSF